MTALSSVRVSQGEGETRTDPPALVTCMAYTAEKGWHVGTVSFDLLRDVQAETYNGQQLAPHGTVAAARRHRRWGTPKCQPCRDAENEYLREYRAKRRAS